jgi:hypothetical protein
MRSFYLAVCAALGLVLTGCGDSTKTPAGDAGKTNGSGGDTKEAAIAENLAKLAAADRAAAEKQKDCPVSGAALGSMGVPIKVPVKDQEVWICCAGCKDSLMGDPDKYLAKLK